MQVTEKKRKLGFEDQLKALSLAAPGPIPPQVYLVRQGLTPGAGQFL